MSDNNHHENEASPAAGVGGLAQSIGTRNLWIIILTMPAVFLVVVAAIIAIFGKPGRDKAVEAESPAVVEAAPAIESGEAAAIIMPAGRGARRDCAGWRPAGGAP